MTNPRRLYSYPQELWPMVEDVALNHAVYSKVYEKTSAAISARHKFYSWRAALGREIAELERKNEPLAGLDNTLQYALTAVCVIEQDEMGAVCLRFMHTSETALSKELRGMTRTGPAARPPDTDAAEESAQRMLERIEDPKTNPYY